MKKVRVCSGRSCTVFGSKRLMEEIQKQTGFKPGESHGTMDLDWCGCLGYCGRSPNIAVNEATYIFEASPETVMDDIDHGGEDMTGRVIDPENIAAFIDDPLI